ncbi:hypothetical protein KBB48_03535 [Candidatus Shapirobacteria bacterium]|nr:hypothetical protein [Candidatus Shapirobacteria bacterium]
MKKYLLIWFIVWVLIAILVSAFGYSDALAGVALAALISLIFMFKMLNDNWAGEVVEIKKEDVYTPDDDGGDTESVEFAYIKLSNGKTKKMRNMGYVVGEKLEKRKGEATIRVIK